uniref:At1g61320/AtMIF1 LRR domain-containing protein n=1 Tax=Hordeum vulgare subsp. vulgare TaxID=112509 RepID=A0A8I6Y3S2_HORVV
MRSLTSLCLYYVNIESDELGFLLSNSLALERLELVECSEIISIKIPSLLQRFSYLKVSSCSILQVIESEAPNISGFYLFHDEEVDQQVQLFFGESLQMKKFFISHSCVLHYALAILPSSMPNLKTLTMHSYYEMVSMPTVVSKFLHLKRLDISLWGWKFPTTFLHGDHDLFLLISCLDASPCLETFNLGAPMRRGEHDSIFEDPCSQLGRIPGQSYANLRRVKITKFCSMKLVVKLTCHILDSTPSLECLTLDITDGGPTCSKIARCFVDKDTFMEAPKALEAIRTYIEGRVPSTAKLNVVEPCSQCPPPPPPPPP